MTRSIVTDEMAQYFELRDKVAALLKVAGVKKRARHYVAEVLIDAGVIDFAELDEAVVAELESSGLEALQAQADAERDEATEKALADLVGNHLPGFGVIVAARATADGAEVMVRSPDFDVPDRWVALSEVMGH